jgi:glutamine cyclotransferase
MILWLLLTISFLNLSLAVLVGKEISSSTEDIAHDSKCFTQGLEIHNGILYESCGLYGKSSVRRVDKKTGEVLLSQSISREIFAEGITVHNNTLYMLTWKSKKLLIYDANTLALLDTKHLLTHTGEGWGLANDGQSLIVSDGSDVLTFFRIPHANDGQLMLTKTKELKVLDPINLRHISMVNELEYVQGKLYCNLWYKDIILQLDPDSGSITERYDLSKLYPKSRRSSQADCLNGIAFDEKDGLFLLTGKLWPKYYKVNLTTIHSKRSNDL